MKAWIPAVLVLAVAGTALAQDAETLREKELRLLRERVELLEASQAVLRRELRALQDQTRELQDAADEESAVTAGTDTLAALAERVVTTLNGELTVDNPHGCVFQVIAEESAFVNGRAVFAPADWRSAAPAGAPALPLPGLLKLQLHTTVKSGGWRSKELTEVRELPGSGPFRSAWVKLVSYDGAWSNWARLDAVLHEGSWRLVNLYLKGRTDRAVEIVANCALALRGPDPKAGLREACGSTMADTPTLTGHPGWQLPGYQVLLFVLPVDAAGEVIALESDWPQRAGLRYGVLVKSQLTGHPSLRVGYVPGYPDPDPKAPYSPVRMGAEAAPPAAQASRPEFSIALLEVRPELGWCSVELSRRVDGNKKTKRVYRVKSGDELDVPGIETGAVLVEILPWVAQGTQLLEAIKVRWADGRVEEIQRTSPLKDPLGVKSSPQGNPAEGGSSLNEEPRKVWGSGESKTELDVEALALRVPLVREDTVAIWTLPPGKRMLLFSLDVPETAHAVEVLISDTSSAITLSGSYERVVWGPEGADFTQAFGDRAKLERLILRRGGQPELRTGSYACLILAESTGEKSVSFRVEIRFSTAKTAPLAWEQLEPLDLASRGDPDYQPLRDLSNRILRPTSAADRELALKAWAEREEPGHPDRAILRASWLCESDPSKALRILNTRDLLEDPRARLVRCKAWAASKAFEEAQREAGVLLEAHPLLLEARVFRAQFASEAGDHSAALSQLFDLMRQDPRHPEVQVLNLDLLARSDPQNFARAWGELASAPVPHVSLLLMALPSWQTVDPQRGLEIAREWAVRKPNLPQFKVAEAMFLAALDREDEALALLNDLKARLRDPSVVDHLERGIKRGEFRED